MNQELTAVLLAQATAEVRHWMKAEGEKLFPQLATESLEYIAQRSQEEVTMADKEARRERNAHARSIAKFRAGMQSHFREFQEKVSVSVPDDPEPSAGLSEMIAWADDMESRLMDVIQNHHRMNLKHCFTCRLVSEATAEKLADLYEIKFK